MKFQLLIKTKMLKNKNVTAFKLSKVVSIMLIKIKMSTIVGILTYMMLSRVEHEKVYNTKAKSIIILHL